MTATTTKSSARKRTTTRTTSAAPRTVRKATTPAQPAQPEASTPDEVSTQEHIRADPRKLLIDVNIRVDAVADAEFIDSIRTWGVLQPIVAVRTTNGLRVRFGHRRTLGAIAAERSDVPVWVVGDENAADDAQIERVLMQFDENEQRSGLSRADHVNTVAQLAAFGLPAEQIGQRLRKESSDVEAALKIGKSDLAMKATTHHDFLDLTQIAALAEFDDDIETVEHLITQARNGAGRFRHAVQAARDARADAAKIEALTARLREAGIQVLSPDSDGAALVDCLKSAETGERLTDQTHAQCPGHAVHVIIDHDLLNAAGQPIGEDDDRDESDWGSYALAQSVCADPTAYGHLDYWVRATTTDTTDTGATSDADDQDGPQAEAARQAEAEQRKATRRTVIANNKAWISAQTVRREWLRNLSKRRSAPARSASFIAAAFANDPGLLTSDKGHAVACDLLGCAKVGYGRSGDLRDLVIKATEARAQVLTLAQILAAYEASTTNHHWRKQHHSPSTQRYLRYLESCGYTLSDVERLACGEDPTATESTDSTESTDEPVIDPGVSARAA